jgi:hypothetical protein
MNNVDQWRSYCTLCTLDTIHRLFFVTRLIINKINKVQWVDFKLENVLVSLHSLKTMGLGPFGASAPLFLRNGELLGHSPIRNHINSVLTESVLCSMQFIYFSFVVLVSICMTVFIIYKLTWVTISLLRWLMKAMRKIIYFVPSL